MPSMGATELLNCWGRNQQHTANNTASINTTRKYCCIHFLLRYTTNAMGRWVGKAQMILKLLRQTSSMRIAHSVTMNTPNIPAIKKNRLSNTSSVLRAHLFWLNDNKPAANSSITKNQNGKIQVPALGASPILTITCLLL